MIKLQEFAKQQGVTDRQIQRLVKKYESELEGLFERQGANGTWLTDAACDILRGKMKKPAIDVYDDAKDSEIERLNEKIKELEERMERKDVLIEKLQARVEEKAGLIEELNGARLLLEDKEEQLKKAQHQEELAKMMLTEKERELETKSKEVENAQNRANDSELLLERLKNRNLWERLMKKYE